jgi:uracil-DNA glycosylase
MDNLKGVTKKWLEVLTADGQLERLAEIAPQIGQDYTPRDFFRFAKFSYNIRVVILGQDPYFQPLLANGLAFSTSDTTVPVSLAKIYNLMINAGLIAARPTSHDFSFLAAQGVLLLNTALTTRVGHPGAHVALWAEYVDEIIRRVSRDAAAPVTWCLWGSIAQSKAALIDERHTVLRWCHPVAMTKPNFTDCDHFTLLKAAHPTIVWDVTATATDFFTDCSARGNQFRDCRASYGVVCTRGLFREQSWAAEIMAVDVPFKDGVERARPTNIRAEGAAVVRALELAMTLINVPNIRVRIHSDSKFWIVDMLTDYIPKWRSLGIPFRLRKNSDLTTRIWELSQRAKHVEFVFVNAWHDRPEPKDPTDLYWWKGNQAAEGAAEKCVNL